MYVPSAVAGSAIGVEPVTHLGHVDNVAVGGAEAVAASGAVAVQVIHHDSLLLSIDVGAAVPAAVPDDGFVVINDIESLVSARQAAINLLPESGAEDVERVAPVIERGLDMRRFQPGARHPELSVIIHDENLGVARIRPYGRELACLYCHRLWQHVVRHDAERCRIRDVESIDVTSGEYGRLGGDCGLFLVVTAGQQGKAAERH